MFTYQVCRFGTLLMSLEKRNNLLFGVALVLHVETSLG